MPVPLNINQTSAVDLILDINHRTTWKGCRPVCTALTTDKGLSQDRLHIRVVSTIGANIYPVNCPKTFQILER